MREPKGSILLLLFLAAALVVRGAPLGSKEDEQLPHSKDYYDGYVHALVDHYDEIFRSQRDVSAEKQEDASKKNTVAEGSGENALEKNDTQNVSENTIGESLVNNSQANEPTNDTVSDKPYVNPEQTGKPPVTDTEKEEAPTPDAHKKTENDQSVNPEVADMSNIQKSMFKASDATNLPETMQDIKFYTGKARESEDMKRKRSTDSDFPVQLDAKPQQPIAAGAAPAVGPSAAISPSSMPAATPDTVADSSKRDDMKSESKIVSHSASTYTPGDPFKNPPQVPQNTPPDPNKEEPYKKDNKESGKEDTEMVVEKKEEDESAKNQKKTEKKQDGKEAEDAGNADDKENEEESEKVSEAKKEFDGKSEEEENDKDKEEAEEEFNSAPNQAFIPMLLVPVSVENKEDYGGISDASGERKDLLGNKREDKKKDDKKKEDDDDDDDEHDNHAYLAPLWGYPGWYEAGHGIPYGYGNDVLYGHHQQGHHGYGHHGHGYHQGVGHYGFGHHGLGHHGLGHHGLGHHSYGHHGSGHHGYGHHGYGHNDLLQLENGVIWPYGGHGGMSYFYSPCGCNSGMRRDLGFGRPLGML
ncbi:protein IWS1 homolog [Rhopilema esculentum]|uniref:protein IWS1 homolog n=1 Tax=Rhopilema esculentum TaxID=499914 RepID=UPI0031E2A1C4|eukprot:gene12155-2764_t